MAYKVFTNGSVLNASEINDNLMRQSVIVFSNAAARTAAITVPLEGMLTYLDDVNRYESWTGSAWLSPFGTTLINQTSFSGVGSATVNSVFSAAYTSYMIRYNFSQSSNFSDSSFTLVNGATPSASNWGWSGSLIAASQALVGLTNFSNNGAAMPICNAGSGQIASGVIILEQPFLAANTTGSLDTFATSSGNGVNDTRKLGMRLANSTSFEGFRLQVAAGTITGNFAIYGLRN